MILEIMAKTNIPDIQVTGIVVRLQVETEEEAFTSLEWDEMDYTNGNGTYNARCKGVFMCRLGNETYLNGKLDLLDNMEVVSLGIESNEVEDLVFIKPTMGVISTSTPDKYFIIANLVFTDDNDNYTEFTYYDFEEEEGEKNGFNDKSKDKSGKHQT